MQKRKTIGSSPLDAVIPRTEDREHPERTPSVVRSDAQERVQKQRLTVHLPVELIERVKNAVYWTPGLTLAGLAEQALAETVGRLEGDRGEAFPPRAEELKGGRPLK